jgi:tetratricopeptide (TPR) repeat protein
MTTDEQYQRRRELFDRAYELPAAEREAFLHEAADGDEMLVKEVLALLDVDDRGGGLLSGSGSEPLGVEGALVGASIGGFRIEELIATGGMGAVYRARQDHPSREVAVKVIRPHAVSSRMMRRFDLEAEVLGRLDHPGIAKIHAASTAETDFGLLPFFAMELVDGVPLTRFAVERGLSTSERIELLAKVCDAVHHAHQNGVIHRDLKPANILVREDGQPKVLDFGIARVTDADIQATTLLTDSGLIIGTLSYMSPEQVGGSHDELDIRADVYALGVVGYEVLTGQLPLELAGKSMTQAALIIGSQPPRPLSDANGPTSRDLETIISTCLEKDKNHRYSSAAELAADLRRFLADQPIQARPPSLADQMVKFARRNRALVAGASLAVVALVVGLVVALVGWNAAATARERAETEAAKANLLNTYLTDMLQAPDPWLDGREVKVVDLLERASENLEELLADQPEVAALAHHRLGFTYRDLGEYEDAERHISRALEISSGVPDFPLETEIEMLSDLGDVHIALGELEEAATILEGAHETASESLDEANPVRLKVQHELAVLRWEQGELDESERLFRDCLDRSLVVLGPEHEDTIVTTAALGNVLQQAGSLEEAKPLLERALEWDLEHHGEDHPSTAIVVNNLGFVYQKLEEHDRALEMFERSLATRQRVHEHDSMSVIIGLNNVGLQLGIMGRGEEALAFVEEAIGIADQILEPGQWQWPALRSTYGRTLMAVGRYGEAERELRASLEGFRAAVGDEHWRTQAVCRNLVELSQATGDPEGVARYQALLLPQDPS